MSFQKDSKSTRKNGTSRDICARSGGGRGTKSAQSKQPFQLWWCSTEDHAEDWFVVAKNARQARAFHSEAEGYDRPSDVTAIPAAKIPAGLEVQVGWPSEALIEACGGVFTNVGLTTSVVLNGMVYQEGMDPMLRSAFAKEVREFHETRGDARS